MERPNCFLSLTYTQRQIQSAFRKAESLGSNSDTSAVQRVHRDIEALALCAEQVLLRDAAVL
jgi:hypothetical protein